MNEENINARQCFKCGSSKTNTSRRPYARIWCLDCGYVNRDEGSRTLNEYKATPDTMSEELKPCPFCKGEVAKFGRDVIRGEVRNTVIHNEIDGKYCPLNRLIFPIEQWNTRTPDTRIVEAFRYTSNLKLSVLAWEDRGLVSDKTSEILFSGLTKIQSILKGGE